MTPPADPPLGDGEFAALLESLGPFEAGARVAVAVSGGPDSMALALLTARWTAERGGSLTALIVDHGLRPESGCEARSVAGMLQARGIAALVLPWVGEKPRAGVQNAAREARYALVEDWCVQAGVLHLLLGHQLEDQAETVLLRLWRSSGMSGLAAMAAVVERPGVRLLRPLLGIARARIVATLEALGQAWISDPSNVNPAFARSRLRTAMPALSEEGLTPERLAMAARRLGRVRAATERETASLLAELVAIHPSGYATIKAAALASLDTETRCRVLAAVLATVGGLRYAPRAVRIERLAATLGGTEPAVGTRTLGGCLLISAGRELVVCREPECVPPVLEVTAPGEVRWDGRFRLRLSGRGTATLRGLGSDGWQRLVAEAPQLRRSPLPFAVRRGLLSLWRHGRPVAVPHLDYGREQPGPDSVVIEQMALEPPRPLQAAGFMLA